MAEFFPRTALEIRTEGAETATNEPELVMRRCLEVALQDRPWIVIQNLLVQDPDKVGTREIDFLVIDPDRGLLVLEVKGGDCRFDRERGWHRVVGTRVKPLDRDPIDQAITARAALIRALSHHAGFDRERTPFVFAERVALVDAHFDFMTLPLGARGRVLGANHCRKPAKLLAELEEALALVAARHPDLPTGEQSPLRRIVDRHLLPSMRSALHVRDEIVNARVVEYDTMRSVRGIVDAAHRLDRLVVEGSAGTGKTYAALHRARREVADGRRTLVTCFNEPLGVGLARATGARALTRATPLRALRTDRIVAGNLHLLAECAANGTGRTPPASLERQERFDAMLAALTLAAREGALGAFDSIVIDEGQDFTPTMLEAIDALAGPATRLAFLHDPNQSIYTRVDDGEIARRFGQPLVLRENLRNSVSITRFLRELAPGRLDDLVTPPTVREGQPVVVAEFAPEDGAGQRDAIGRIVRHLVDSEGVRPEDVMILSPFRRERGALAEIDSVAGIPLVGLDEAEARSDDEPPAIAWATLHRFKGLEAPAVILHDVRGAAENVSYEAILTGASRARNALYILRSSDYAGGAALPVQGALP